jgi:hypothetical protein
MAKSKVGERKDFIEHGSDEHASLLGLRKAVKEDEYQVNGWTLADLVQFGPNATREYIKAVLAQKVNELTVKPEIPTNAQSTRLF